MLKSLVQVALILLTSVFSFAQYNISVDVNQVTKTLSSNALGINIDYLMDGSYISEGTTAATTATLKSMGMKMLRYPGGEKSDNYLWSTSPYDKAKPQMVLTGDCNFPSNDSRFVEADTKTCKKEVLDFDEFMTLCKQVGAEPMIVCAYDAVYFGGSVAATNPCAVKPIKQQLIENAKQWVQYANKTKNYNIKYWCIGNESWNDCTYNGCVDAIQYATDIVEFTNAMRSVDPSIKIIANGRGTEWWQTLLQNAAAANAIDYLGVSCYPIYGFTGGYDYYRTNNFNLRSEVQTAADAIAAYASPANKAKIKVMATEFNAIDFSDEWVNTNDVGHALVTADILGQCLKYEQVESMVFWNTRWITNVTVPELVFDALNKNSTPNANGLLLSVWGNNILPNIVSASEQGPIKSYAFYDKLSSKLNLILINKDNVSQPVAVTVSGFTPAASLSRWEYSGTNAQDVHPTYIFKDSGKVNTYPYNTTLAANSVTVLKLSAYTDRSPTGPTEIKLINNPVKGTAYFSMANIQYIPVSVDLYDLKGSLLRKYPQVLTNGVFSLNVNGLPAGIYFLRFISPVSQHTIKMIKN